MGDSDDDYDRKRRDKFRGERSDYREQVTRRPPPSEDRRRDDWNDRSSGGGGGGGGGGSGGSDWNRNRGGGGGGGGPPRSMEYRLGNQQRGGGGGGHEFSPPHKRQRGDWGDHGNNTGNRYNDQPPFPPPPHPYQQPHPYDHPHPMQHPYMPPPPQHHRESSEGGSSGGHPNLLSFKAWLVNQDDSISDQDALAKYAEYKQDFKKQQLNEFFLAHKDEEWFKNKYHPDESAKRKEEQFQNLKKRMNLFMEFMDKKRFEGLSLDAPHADKLTKLMDWFVIRLEDGTDELAAKLLDDSRHAPTSTNATTPSTTSTPTPSTTGGAKGEEGKENGEKEKKGEDGEEGSEEGDGEIKDVKVKEEEGEGDGEIVESEGDTKEDVSVDKERKISTGSAVSTGGSVGGESKDKKEGEEELPQLHRTASVFLRNLSPAVPKAEVEALCLKYPGFLRCALADPQPERRWYRRGWVTFKRDVNIKEICWQLNSIRLKDAELGAIVNRDLARRVRTVNGLTPHKTIVRNDIRLASQVIQFLDSKWALWAEDPNAVKKESFGVYSTNPVLRNITDYLIEEASAEEDELLGMGGGGGSDGEIEGGEIGNGKGNAIERDDELIQVLDRLILYLRFVYSLDYYNHAEYPYEDDMPNRLGILHGRGNPPASTQVSLSELQDYNRSFEQKIGAFCSKVELLNDDDVKTLGRKDEETEIEKFIQANTQELGKDKWLCPLSGKKFKGAEFVRKHIQNKHEEKLEEVKKEVAYFNNYLQDPKRPKSIDGTRKEGMGGSGTGFQQRQGNMMGGNDFHQPPFPPYGGYGGGPGYGGYGGPPQRPYYGGYSGPQRGGRPPFRGGNRAIISYRDLDAPPDPDEF